MVLRPGYLFRIINVAVGGGSCAGFKILQNLLGAYGDYEKFSKNLIYSFGTIPRGRRADMRYGTTASESENICHGSIAERRRNNKK